MVLFGVGCGYSRSIPVQLATTGSSVRPTPS
jgi:hypothetical protein